MTRHDKTMVHDGSHLWGAKRRGLACNTGAVLRHLEKTGLAMSPAVGENRSKKTTSMDGLHACVLYIHIITYLGV